MATQTIHRIGVPYPDTAPLALRIRLGPCRLRVHAGDGPEWVTGSYEDPTGALPLDTHVVVGGVLIAQRAEPFQLQRPAIPTLDLAIGRARPFALSIEAGASEDSFDLGGLPLSKLDVEVGAGRYEIDFSTPNPVEMSTLDLGAGAGAVTARHLANANFAELKVSAGVSAWTLDLSGELRRDAHGRIEAGLTSIDVSVPAATAARIVTSGFAAGRSVAGEFGRDGDGLLTPAAVLGKRPLLALEVSMALGSLTLRAI